MSVESLERVGPEPKTSQNPLDSDSYDIAEATAARLQREGLRA